jgi:hypothetical protein
MMINQKFIFFWDCELYKAEVSLFTSYSVECFQLSGNILDFELIFKCIFRLVFWSPLDCLCSLCTRICMWNLWYFPHTYDLSPLSYCKLYQYETCAWPRRETSQQLGLQCTYVSQRCSLLCPQIMVTNAVIFTL